MFKEKLILNIRGFEFRVETALLARYPTTRLGKLVNLKTTKEILKFCDDYDPNRNECYFNRDPFMFNKILNYYTTSKLHIDQNDCALLVREELAYWEIDEGLIELCCRRLFDDQIKSINWFHMHIDELVQELNFVNTSNKMCMSNLKEKCWNLFEHPNSSIYAKILLYFSMTLICISMIELVLTTIPELDDYKMAKKYCSNISHLFNQTDYLNLKCEFLKVLIDSSKNFTLLEMELLKNCHFSYCEKKFTRIFTIFELIFTFWFTSEFLIRFICCPSKLNFVKTFMNILDFVCVATYLISNSISFHESFRPLLALRLIRIFFIFKLSKHLESLKILIYTVKECHKELLTLLIYLSIGVLFFSCVMHYCEKDMGNERFNSIFDSFWWAFVTMTTVGYGDIIPFTISGKLLACICILISIVLLAMPIGIISNRFIEYQRLQLISHKLRNNTIKIKN